MKIVSDSNGYGIMRLSARGTIRFCGGRMGICQTCVLPLESGHIRDFRSGVEHGAGDRINTCISAASGDCTIKI